MNCCTVMSQWDNISSWTKQFLRPTWSFVSNLESFQVMKLQNWHEVKDYFFEVDGGGMLRTPGKYRFFLEDLPHWTSVLGLIFWEGVALLWLYRVFRYQHKPGSYLHVFAIACYCCTCMYPIDRTILAQPKEQYYMHSTCFYFFGWVALRQNFWRSLLCQMIWTVISLAYRQLRRDGMWVTNLGMEALKPWHIMDFCSYDLESHVLGMIRGDLICIFNQLV